MPNSHANLFICESELVGNAWNCLRVSQPPETSTPGVCTRAVYNLPTVVVYMCETHPTDVGSGNLGPLGWIVCCLQLGQLVFDGCQFGQSS